MNWMREIRCKVHVASYFLEHGFDGGEIHCNLDIFLNVDWMEKRFAVI